MFKKILIANRGEIACRVAATARRMGIQTVAVYSDADASAKHVQACDEAVHIGGSAPKDSYLRWERILQAAKDTGAQAVHPGYGFLSENADFAKACAAAGLVFIGPPASAILAMGLKAESKRLMESAGVPLVPGYHGADQEPALLQREADRIGYLPSSRPAQVVAARACAWSKSPKTSPLHWPAANAKPSTALAATRC
jgi:3-methylcrotonyl-CoA carboxylase alpha subunit